MLILKLRKKKSKLWGKPIKQLLMRMVLPKLHCPSTPKGSTAIINWNYMLDKPSTLVLLCECQNLSKYLKLQIDSSHSSIALLTAPKLTFPASIIYHKGFVVVTTYSKVWNRSTHLPFEIPSIKSTDGTRPGISIIKKDLVYLWFSHHH